MTRIVLQALGAGVVAAVLLLQLKETQELFAWEILLAVLLVWLMSRLPGRVEVVEPPLFDPDRRGHARPPRSLSSTEFLVIDALQGYLSPERRLRPALRRLASHRLERHGHGIESPRAVELLGEENWRWLLSDDDEVPEAKVIDDLLTKLEVL